MANEAEARRWNDDRWTSVWPQREALTTTVTPELLEACRAVPGQRVLDVGCGGGGLADALGARVSPGGTVVGVDLSAALLALARSRVEGAGRANVRFVQMDMQIGTVAGEPFDLAVSQFGVMFFDQPTKAFGNIGAHLRPGGRLVFICWQSVDRNPWHIGTALAGLMPAPPPPAPGASPVGPFTLGDPARTASLLTGAGFIDVSVDPRTTIALAPASAIVDTTLLEFMGVPPGARAEAAAVIGRHLAQFEGDGTTYAFPLAYQVVTAVRP